MARQVKENDNLLGMLKSLNQGSEVDVPIERMTYTRNLITTITKMCGGLKKFETSTTKREGYLRVRRVI